MRRPWFWGCPSRIGGPSNGAKPSGYSGFLSLVTLQGVFPSRFGRQFLIGSIHWTRYALAVPSNPNNIRENSRRKASRTGSLVPLYLWEKPGLAAGPAIFA
ncbi:MAG: hypothetical protein ACPGLY_13425 [Rubripirellula sp.]